MRLSVTLNRNNLSLCCWPSRRMSLFRSSCGEKCMCMVTLKMEMSVVRGDRPFFRSKRRADHTRSELVHCRRFWSMNSPSIQFGTPINHPPFSHQLFFVSRRSFVGDRHGPPGRELSSKYTRKRSVAFKARNLFVVLPPVLPSNSLRRCSQRCGKRKILHKNYRTLNFSRASTRRGTSSDCYGKSC
jgi:hypothetical protein